MTTPGPFTARPLEDGVWIVVGRDDDEDDTHTVCRAEPCETHTGRAEADARSIAAALNSKDPARCRSCDHSIDSHHVNGCWFTPTQVELTWHRRCSCSISKNELLAANATPDD